ncbi:hypothetical protein [Prosthecobacter vanneervenii]|uniref:Uncharacterized protein n=1 Tax=Prosthecobacter vanneervenii TaxID=48466 RepID=A0A7W7Y861_9BACT|nr:hypothetical protein [Prosthecobacter vanneervenii]MBB5031417.1 hypothetical protein [Prosthecobacter vanneervenii]
MEDKPAPMTNTSALRRLLGFAQGHWRIALLKLALAVGTRG